MGQNPAGKGQACSSQKGCGRGPALPTSQGLPTRALESGSERTCRLAKMDPSLGEGLMRTEIT